MKGKKRDILINVTNVVIKMNIEIRRKMRYKRN